MQRLAHFGLILVLSFAVISCTQKKEEPAAAPVVVQKPKPRFGRLNRNEFNFRAQERFVPLFWRSDANHNEALDPDELVVLWTPQGMTLEMFVEANGFTKAFADLYERLLVAQDESTFDATERKRRELVRLELAQGRPTLVESDFTTATENDKTIVTHLLKAAMVIEQIHAKQLGTDTLSVQLQPADPASMALFHRNQGPWCVAPKTEKDEGCNALANLPKHISGLYPRDIQEADPKFCEMLQKEKNASALMGHFSVVLHAGERLGTLTPEEVEQAEEAEKEGKKKKSAPPQKQKGFSVVPYNLAYASESKVIAEELTAAANATPPEEQAFKAYLLAAAKAFLTNDWEPANAAWVAMSPTNSKWYLRIAPDEVYYEPCAWKAGYATQLARINPDSIEWQKKLEPVKADMEKALAALAGPPYKARDVKFKLPDFIDVVVNSGDQRAPHGATIGQSLPNWGKVAESGGRTVAMTNLYTDVDSREALLTQMSSLMCPETMKLADADAKGGIMSTVLHEAAHNLGPSHDYKVNGKADDEIFGGPTAATMEELKAQTAALYFADWLAARGVITADEANRSHVRDIAWAFGHISRGMYDGAKKPKNYSQLASIQLGTLSMNGALVWKSEEKAANGTDVGCFEVDFAKWKPAIDALAKRVLEAKSRGDVADANKMRAELVDAVDSWSAAREIITERWLRAPKATFVYSIRK